MRRRETELAAVLCDVLHAMARKVGHATRVDGRVQGAEQAQRVHVAVERTVATADHLGTDVRQHLRHLRMVHDLGLVVDDARLVVQPLQDIGARLQLLLRQGEVETARPLEGDIEAGLLLQEIGEAAPGVGRADGPAGIGREAEALLCTQTRAKLPRLARTARSPSSSTTTRQPSRARPQAVATPTRPPPTTATS